jgi:hypothetical protein
VIAFTIARAAQEICGQAEGTVWFHFKQMLTDAVREGAIPTRSAEGEPLLLTADLRAWAESLPEYHADRAAREARRVEYAPVNN